MSRHFSRRGKRLARGSPLRSFFAPRFAPKREGREPPSGEARLLPYLLGIPWLSAVLTVLLSISYPTGAQTYALYPLLFGAICLGLPHGALDHLLPARLSLPWSRHPVQLGGYLLGYVALASAFLLLWFLSPRAAFIGFLLVTIFHWGHADLRFMERFLDRRSSARWGAWITGLVRGALPIALPVLAFPETAESLYHYAAVGLGVTPTSVDLASPRLSTALAVLLAVALTAYVLNALSASAGLVAFTVDMLELGLLVALFTLVPAYLAVGVYFAFWHAFRHLARLLILETEDAQSVADGRFGRPLRRLMLDSLPLTVAALALLGGLYLFGAARIGTLEGFVALYLVLISALTLPHTVVVTLMDVWQPFRRR